MLLAETGGRGMTNFEKIKNMSAEELAKLLGDMILPECGCCPADDTGWCKDCHQKWREWLEQEVGEWAIS